MLQILLLLVGCWPPFDAGAPPTANKQRLFAVDGKESVVEVQSIDEQAVQLLVLGKPRELAPASINRIQFSSQTLPGSDGFQVRLVDGSILRARELQVDDQSRCTIVQPGSVRQTIRTRNIATIVLQPVTTELDKQWQDLLQANSRTADWLVFERGGVLDYIEGEAGEITSDSVSFSTQGRTAQAPLDRVTGLSYFHAQGREFADPLALLVTNDGSQLVLRSLRVKDAASQEESQVYLVETICGATLTLTAEQIFQVDFAALRFQYLSDLPPATIEWDPVFYNESIYEYQATLNRPRFNSSFSDQPISLNFEPTETVGAPIEHVEYEKGIAMKGGTRLVFSLDGRYSRFQSWLGFAPMRPETVSWKWLFRLMVRSCFGK